MTRPPLRRAALSCLALAATVSALTGCARDGQVLARVEDRVITVEDFAAAAATAQQRYVGSPDSAKAQLIKDLVDRELLIRAAMRERLQLTPEFQVYRQRLEDQTLREAILKRLLGDDFPVSAAEAREFYERRGTVTRCQLIFSYQEGMIREAQKDLARGEDFTVVADRYNPTGLVPPHGEVGFLQPGALFPPLDDVVRTGPIGRVLGPIQTPGEGWFLLRLEGRRAAPQPPFEQQRELLTEMLRQRKQRVTLVRVIESLRTAYQVKLEPDASHRMVEMLRPAPGTEAAVHGSPPLSPEDRRVVLARYRGGVYTLGDAEDDLHGEGPRPNLSMLPTVDRWIDSQTIQRVGLVEARARHLDEEPEVQRRLRERLDNALLDAYYQRAVIERIQLDASDLEAAYERFKPSFVRLSEARVVSVTLRDSAAAAVLAGKAPQAPSLREAAATAATGVRAREEKLAFPADSPLWTQFEGRIAAMQPGDVAGPYPVASGWLVFQLIDKRQDAPPLESLPPSARGQLQGVATEMKREARLAAVTDSLRHTLSPIVIDEGRLRRLPWPQGLPGPTPS